MAVARSVVAVQDLSDRGVLGLNPVRTVFELQFSLLVDSISFETRVLCRLADIQLKYISASVATAKAPVLRDRVSRYNFIRL